MSKAWFLGDPTENFTKPRCIEAIELLRMAVDHLITKNLELELRLDQNHDRRAIAQGERERIISKLVGRYEHPHEIRVSIANHPDFGDCISVSLTKEWLRERIDR